MSKFLKQFKITDIIWQILLVISFLIWEFTGGPVWYYLGRNFFQEDFIIPKHIMIYVMSGILIFMAIFATIIFKAGQMIYFLFAFKGKELIKGLVSLAILLVLIFIAMICSDMYKPKPANTFVRGLKMSIEKESVAVAKVQTWLNSFEIPENNKYWPYDNFSWPKEIASFPVVPGRVEIYKTDQNKKCVRFHYYRRHFFMNPELFGIVIGANSEELPFEYRSKEYRLDFEPGGFIWYHLHY